MPDPAEHVAFLRDRIEAQEEELEAAVRDLKDAASRMVGPTEWLKERPLLCLSGALAFGWWLGSRRNPRAGRRWR
jgi:hypothetical protein